MRNTHLLVLLFLAANLLGVAAGASLYGNEMVREAATAYQSPASGLGFFAVLILATALLLGLYRYDRQLLVKLWFGSALLLTSLILFNAFLPILPAAALTVALTAARFWTDDLLLRNALDTVPFAGAGALFGTLLGFQAVLVFAGLLAVYDYLAVNRMGHMVTLAKEGASSDTFMGFRYPKEGADLSELDENADGGGETVQVGVLGGGDVILPIVVAVSVIPLFGPGAAVSVVAGSAAALFVFLKVVQGQGEERFYPAVPVVGSGAVVGLVLFLALAAL